MNSLTNGNAQGSGYEFLMMGFDQDQPYGAQYPQGDVQVMATDPSDVNNSLVPVQGGGWYKNPDKGLNGSFSTDNLNFNSGSYVKATVILYLNDAYGFYTHTVTRFME